MGEVNESSDVVIFFVFATRVFCVAKVNGSSVMTIFISVTYYTYTYELGGHVLAVQLISECACQ